MSNHMPNGAVLPYGLLGENAGEFLQSFKRTYQNTALKAGLVIQSYPISDSNNLNKMVTEYDVMTFEQHEDQGSTTITYRHCLMASSLGGIADFFDMTLRKVTENKHKGPITQNQNNGSVVLLLCLNGTSDSAVIVGALPHPDRKTTLTDEGPRMEGEYNGINIKVEKDGSTNLTFKGATDNYGKPIDSTQGNTVISIEKDGSYQVNHGTVTQRLDKNGKASLTANDDISNTTQKNFNVTATENIALMATKNFNLQSADWTTKATGTALMQCQKVSINSDSDVLVKGSQFKVEAESMANIKAATITLDGIVSLGGQGGQPVLLLNTMMLGIGNLGSPVISTAISGYAVKVTAQ